MKLDLNKYRINAKFIQNWHRNHPDEDIETMITIQGISVHCPLVIMCFFLAEGIGFTPELTRLIDMFIAYYGYKEILGQSEDSPYLTLGRKDVKISE
jgi:hypothetical protein